MATTLEDAIRRRQIEEALSHLDTGATALDTAPSEDTAPAPEEVSSGSDYPASESGPKIEVPKKVKGEYGDWNEWPTADQIPAGHIDLAPPGPTPTPESSFGPDLQTDPETGTRYVTDPSVASGLVPFAELALSRDKESFKPTDVTLPKVVSEATAPAPDKLDLVERATLVQFPKGQPATMPWHPAGQKPVPGFIAGSKNAILNPAAGVIPPAPVPDKLTQVERGELVSVPPGTAPRAVGVAAPVTYPTIAEDQGAPGTPPKVQPAQPVTGPQLSGPKAPGTHTELAPPGQMDLRPDELQAPATVQPPPSTQLSTQPTVKPAVAPVSGDWKTWTTVDGTPAEPQAVQPVAVQPSGGDTGVANYFSKRGEKPITSSDDSRLTTVKVGDQTWTVHKEAAPHFQGFLQELADQGAPITSSGGWNYRNIAGSKNLSQHAYGGAIDVSQEGRDVVSPAFRKWIADNPGALQAAEQHWGIYGGERFGDLGHFEWGGSSGGTDTGSGQVLQQLKSSGLNTTHYGYIGDPNLDADSAAASGKYVQQMVPGYDVALNAAAAKLVGNPQPGQEFQYAGRTWRYGDKVPEKYGDARFDIFDPNNTALSGGQLGGTTQAAAQPKKQDWESWATLSPAEQTTATAQGVQKSQDILNTLQSKSTNMPDWFHTLEQPIPGVSDEVRTAVRDEYKKQITAYAQDYYKEPDPDKAFARIMSAPNLLTSAGEIWTKAGANFQHAWLSIAQQADSPTQTKLIDFVNAIQPDATPEARTALINQVMSKTGKERTDFVNHLYNAAQVTHPDTVQNVNMSSLLDAIDVSAQPGMQAKEAANHAQVSAAVAQNLKDLREDPTMENTYGGTISNAIAQMPKNVLEAITPVIGQSAMFSEIYTDTAVGLRKDHPDWSDDQIKAKAAAASLPQDVLQELVNAATLGMGSGLTKGVTNPIARIAANAIMHGGIAATAGAAQQGIANVATGRPPTEGVPQAAITGGIQGVIGGAISGRHPEETLPEATTRAPLGEEPPVQPPVTGPKGGAVRGAESSTLTGAEEGTPLRPPTPLTSASVLGPDVPDVSVPWHKPGPIITRPEERTTFSPSELVQKLNEARASGSPEQVRQAIIDLRPDLDPSQQGVFFQPQEELPIQGKQETAPPPQIQQPATRLPVEPAPKMTPAHTVVYNDLVNRGMDADRAQAFVSRASGTTPAEILTNVQTQMRSEAGAPPPVQPRPPLVGEAEPWVSKIANRFTLDRMVNGELGPVEPGVGVTKEEMLARGLRMGPEAINQHVSNVMNDVGGNPRDQAAAIRAEEARLTQVSRNASLASEADPTNQQLRIQADEAFKYLTDFHNGPVAKLKNNWHAQGMTLQGEIPVDLSTYNGLRDAYLRSVGETPPKSMEPVMRNTAKRVRDTSVAEATALKKLGAEIDRQSAKRFLPTDEQIREKVMRKMKVDPC